MQDISRQRLGTATHVAPFLLGQLCPQMQVEFQILPPSTRCQILGKLGKHRQPHAVDYAVL